MLSFLNYRRLHYTAVWNVIWTFFLFILTTLHLNYFNIKVQMTLKNSTIEHKNSSNEHKNSQMNVEIVQINIKIVQMNKRIV